MILKIEGTDREIINFVEGLLELCYEEESAQRKVCLDQKFPTFWDESMHLASRQAGFNPAALGQTRTDTDNKKEKMPADKPKPYSGGQNNPQEKKEAKVARKNDPASLNSCAAASEKKEEAKPAKKKAAKKNKPAKTNSPKPKAREITIQEIKDEVPLEECTSIPEAIEAILTICSTSASSLARALELSPSDISVAKNGKVYPYIERAFKQYLQFGDTSPSE